MLTPPEGAGVSPGDDGAAAAPLVGDDAGGGDDATTLLAPGPDAASPTVLDASAPIAPGPEASGPPFDAGPDGTCNQPLGVGDLVVDELMIESVAGAGDYGEWLEIESTLGCAVDLRGLHGETASGSKVRTFDVGFDLWIPAGGTVVVADSEDPTLNHELPGIVLTWSGHPGDVLRNQGGTVTLRFDDTIVDTVTWPAYKLAVGASLELPADCPLANAGDLTKWQQAVSSWFPGFRGTPNAPNTDVRCQ